MKQSQCRFCAAYLTIDLVDLGKTPLANSFLPIGEEAIEAEKHFPLHVKVCENCWLVQVEETVDASSIFKHDYAYLSSYSESWVEHARSYALAAKARFGLTPQSRVVEIASNDGYLLQHFTKMGISVLGVEPAGHAAQMAIDKGIETEVAFFGRETAVNLTDLGIKADLMVANNVLAHVPDIRDFVAGFQVLLKPEGVITFEFPHLLNLIKKIQFDTIYHEHYSYISLIAAENFLESADLRAFDVEHLSTHGGSLRIFVCHRTASHAETEALVRFRALEKDHALDRPAGYAGFAERVAGVRREFRKFLQFTHNQGKLVAGFGAAAKGNTFLNYCGVTRNDVGFVVDSSLEKQGKFLPGSHIPVYPPKHLREVRPDYVIILPWNLREEISKSHSYISQWGGKFVVAVPAIDIFTP
jgi:2-polyprenyl-3-methyl-5-hydroxy-6-metoxy-1,4-benzoquinol methylase